MGALLLSAALSSGQTTVSVAVTGTIAADDWGLLAAAFKCPGGVGSCTVAHSYASQIISSNSITVSVTSPITAGNTLVVLANGCFTSHCATTDPQAVYTISDTCGGLTWDSVALSYGAAGATSGTTKGYAYRYGGGGGAVNQSGVEQIWGAASTGHAACTVKVTANNAWQPSIGGLVGVLEVSGIPATSFSDGGAFGSCFTFDCAYTSGDNLSTSAITQTGPDFIAAIYHNGQCIGGDTNLYPTGFTGTFAGCGGTRDTISYGSVDAPIPPAPSTGQYVRGVWFFDQSAGGGGTGGGTGGTGGSGGTVTPLAISTISPLPSATQSSLYSVALQASGGTPEYSWQVISGTLPSGLSLDATLGTISGTPTTVGTSAITVQVTDSVFVTATKALSITVNQQASSTCPAAFSDSFSTGTLSSNWTVDTGDSPTSPNNTGTFSDANVDLSQGMLGLKLTQTISGTATSVGAEVRSLQKYCYGTFDWYERDSSTATTPNGAGSADSGSVSGLFTYYNNSENEIDFETEGQSPTSLELTNWKTTSAQQTSSMTESGMDSAFHHKAFVWSASKIEYYFDDVLIGTHTLNIPSAPAFIIMNHWGTNDASFGGTATAATRWLWIQGFSYSPSTTSLAHSVLLTWSASAGATSYNVWRSTINGACYPAITSTCTKLATGVTQTQYTDGTVLSAHTYFYVVTAVNSGGESTPSNQIAVTIP